jgi:uncharacterized protein DUF6677
MSEPERPSPLVPVLLAWLVPGLGHAKLGRTWPAVFVFAGVLPLFVLGMVLGGFENVSHERHAFYFAVQAWCGGPAVAATLATAGTRITEALPHYDVGTLYCAVAGLLNLVAITDVWARCKRGDPEQLTAMMEKARAGEIDPLAPENLLADQGPGDEESSDG